MTPVDLPVFPYIYDDDLVEATRTDGTARWRVYVPPAAAVVLGRGSSPERELNLEAVRADRVPVLRRRGGGCAVVIDPGDVVAAAALPARGIAGSRTHFDRLTTWLAAGLAAAGIAGLERSGVFDLTLDGRKVSGGSVYRAPGLLFWTASVMVSPHVDLMERYLRHPPREPDYRAGRAHGAFVRGLAMGGGAGASAMPATSRDAPPAWPGDAAALAAALRRHLAPIGLWCGEPAGGATFS